MRPSEACKQAGLKSLDELSQRSGRTTQTLRNWWNSPEDRPLFLMVLKAAALDAMAARLAEVEQAAL